MEKKAMRRVLIIEDDATLRFSIVQVLSLAGYECLEAATGLAGLDLLRRDGGIDIILSDVKMPKMDGLQLLNELRADYPDVPVIMMTGHGTISSAIQAMREGAINYLLKPVGKRQLLEAVQEAHQIRSERLQKRQLMEQVVVNLQALNIYTPVTEDLLKKKAEPEQNNTSEEARFVQVRDMIIDQHRLSALFKGEPLELTPTEFEILNCLMQAGGRVVTFEEIAFHLRGITVDRDEARTMLSSHFTNLRAKLAAAGCNDYVMNSRSNGYFINADEGAV